MLDDATAQVIVMLISSLSDRLLAVESAVRRIEANLPNSPPSVYDPGNAKICAARTNFVVQEPDHHPIRAI